MRRFLAGLLLATLGLLVAATASAQQRGLNERRVALVIGNASYKVSPLKNPVNDARDVANALRRLDFEVIERQNLGREGFSAVVREFGDKLRGATVGLFYFAGHGMQVKGRNFLVPVDADIAREDEVPYRGFDVNEVLDKMDSARTVVNLVLLDACRNNPFARSFQASQTGLAQMDAPAGTLIAFATAPGSVAQDGDTGVNGLYTGALLRHVATPGLEVEQMFRRVRVEVADSSKNKQVPWESSSLNRAFSFAEGLAAPPAAVAAAGSIAVPGPAKPAAAVASEMAFELAFWDAIKDSRNPADYRAYLEQYPNGRFGALARLRSSAGFAPAGSAAPGTEPMAASVIRWKQGDAERSLDLRAGRPVTVQAESPEGLYLAAVVGGSVHWIDAVRGAVLRSSRAFDDSAASATQAEFSPDGRWLLLRLQRTGQVTHQLMDVATGEVLWDKPSVLARFDPEAPLLLLQGAQGESQTLRLP